MQYHHRAVAGLAVLSAVCGGALVVLLLAHAPLWLSFIPLGCSILAAASAALLATRSGRQAEARVRDAATVAEAMNRRLDLINTHVETNRIHQVELAGQINESVRNMATICADLLEVAEGMASFDDDFESGRSSVATIHGAIAELDHAVAHATEATSQTAAAVEEISASIKRVSEESSNRYEEVKDLVDVSRQGQSEMTVTLEVIREVTGGIDALQGFIAIINDIASRTSLLAMNAAIEAAHAGQAGKGFAVVADEVRKLAESSASNAAGIAKRLQTLIAGIRRAEEATRHTSELFASLEGKVQRASDSFLEIRSGTAELALGGQEILKAVANMKETSYIIKDGSAGIVMASDDLSSRMTHLKDTSATLLDNVRRSRSQAAQVNRSFLATAQSDIAQMQSGEQIAAALAEGSAGGGESGDNASTRLSVLMLQHMVWVSRIRAVLDGVLRLDAAEVSDHRKCDLGTWLAGLVNDSSPGLQELRMAHQAMHEAARQTVQDYNSARQQQSEAGFAEVRRQSEAVVALLQKYWHALHVGAGSGQFLAWRSEYELGHRLIDQQHRQLVSLINELHAAVLDGRSKATMDKVIDELVKYTRTHFRDEEALFAASDYPDTETHREEHAEFIRKVQSVVGNYHNGTSILGTDTLVFLKDWLIKHINGTDRGYARYLGS